MTVIIAGAGMVGSWTALALARMVDQVFLYDFDTVEAGNIGVQAYSAEHIGLNKADAVKDMAFGLDLHAINGPFSSDAFHGRTDALVLAVDTIPARREIATQAADFGVPLLIDTRVLGEIAHIQVVPSGNIQEYIDNLPEGDDLVHAACGAKGTAFAGMWVASQVCAAINAYGRRVPYPARQTWHVGMNQSVMAEEQE